MIRINLLRHEPSASWFGGDRAANGPLSMFAWLCLILAVGGVTGGRWWLTRDLQRVQADLAQTEAAIAALAASAEDGADDERRLTQRAALLAEFEARESVHPAPALLRAITQYIPADVWLTTMEVGAGEVTLEGRCGSVGSLSEFIEHLNRARVLPWPLGIAGLGETTPGEHGVMQFTVRGGPR